MVVHTADIECREGAVVASGSLGCISTALGLTDVVAQWVWRDGDLVRRVVLAQCADDTEADDCIELSGVEARLLGIHLGDGGGLKWVAEDFVA